MPFQGRGQLRATPVRGPEPWHLRLPAWIPRGTGTATQLRDVSRTSFIAQDPPGALSLVYLGGRLRGRFYGCNVATCGSVAVPIGRARAGFGCRGEAAGLGIYRGPWNSPSRPTISTQSIHRTLVNPLDLICPAKASLLPRLPSSLAPPKHMLSHGSSNMESADDLLYAMSDTMTTPSDSPATLGFPSAFESNLEPHLYSALFHPSFSPQLPTVPSLEGTPTPDDRREVTKREKKKQPKLEFCTSEQIAVCICLGGVAL